LEAAANAEILEKIRERGEMLWLASGSLWLFTGETPTAWLSDACAPPTRGKYRPGVNAQSELA
jgi:hypothetical protein